ncbi:MAG: hypothetical protein K2P58_03335 [Hyphomonadaceae bacterium]|nr:hypothetical protein [Hyphomonadaceae bacterium]
MDDIALSRLTGAFGLATIAFWLPQFPLYMVGAPPLPYESARYVEHLRSIHDVALTRILLDQGVYVSLLAFVAGLREVMKRKRPDWEWLATLMFGAAAVWLGVTLVADGLAGGAVLDAISASPDPTAVRALILGTFLIYNGSTAFVMTALFLTAAGLATLATKALAAWTGWFALFAAALCIACVPAMYGGPVDYHAFYNPGGFGPAVIASFPPLFWFVAVSVILVGRRRESRVDAR